MPGDNTIVIQMGTALIEAERLVIEATLQRTGWNMSHCARVLGIDYENLYGKLKAHRLAEQNLRPYLIQSVEEGIRRHESQSTFAAGREEKALATAGDD